MTAARRALTDLLLTAAAALGVLCAILALTGWLCGFGVILFRTGSMSPSIPAGSAALVREVPAADVRIGDVVTVDRPGTLPVTHRVARVDAVPGDPEARDLVLRGDANSADDPSPYRVDSVRRVLGSVAGLAPALARWQQPAVLGPMAVLVAAGVVVAFWPRRSPARTADGQDFR